MRLRLLKATRQLYCNVNLNGECNAPHYLFIRKDLFMQCVYCIKQVPIKRHDIGYVTCLDCGDKQARSVKHTVVPMHKSNYVVVSNPRDLIGINTKGGLTK